MSETKNQSAGVYHVHTVGAQRFYRCGIAFTTEPKTIRVGSGKEADLSPEVFRWLLKAAKGAGRRLYVGKGPAPDPAELEVTEPEGGKRGGKL